MYSYYPFLFPTDPGTPAPPMTTTVYDPGVQRVHEWLEQLSDRGSSKRRRLSGTFVLAAQREEVAGEGEEAVGGVAAGAVIEEDEDKEEGPEDEGEEQDNDDEEQEDDDEEEEEEEEEEERGEEGEAQKEQSTRGLEGCAIDETTPRNLRPLNHAIAPTANKVSSIMPHSTLSSNTISSPVTPYTTNPSRKRKRSSPAEDTGFLLDGGYRVEQRFIIRRRNLPQPLRALASSMKRIGSGQRPLGVFRGMEFAYEIAQHVQQCGLLHASEAAWICKIYAPLLERAWRLSAYHVQLQWECISTARIEPSTLLPGLSPTEPNPTKKADFAITLFLDPEVEFRLRRANIDSLNQTYYGPLKYSPSAVSIIIKPPDESWDDGAILPLSTWALGQVAKLRLLLEKVGNGGASIPALPLVVVEGEAWSVLFFEPGLTQALLWRQVVIVEEMGIHGINQLLAALQRLMCWAETVYRVWFEANILNPLLDTIP